MAEMLSDNVAVVLGAVALLLAVLAPLCTPLFRWKRRDDSPAGDAELQPVSVIIVSHDDAQQLQRHLPAFLQQDYAPGYEVIVVTEKGDHEVDNVLKRISADHAQQESNARLYVTYIPETSRYMSRRKLAVTLGVKAAANEWLLMTDSDCEPASPHWLAAMASHCSDDKTLVVGYSAYDDDTPSYRRYAHFLQFAYLRRECDRWAYRTNCPNLMFRKSMFMQQEGFLGSLELVRGEYDFLVNKFAQPGATAVETAPEAWVVQDAPSAKTWSNKHVYYMETRKSLLRSRRHRLVFDVHQTVMRLFTGGVVAALAYALLTSNWLLAAVAGVAVAAELALRCTVDSMAVRRFGEHFALAPVYDRRIMWTNAYFIVRHKCADRRDFTTHKQ